jgi:dTDP-4-amino-4,6-dideoxygalactose transaminase
MVPAECEHNGHLFYLLLPLAAQRTEILADLNASGFNAVFPLRAAALGAGRTTATPAPLAR